MTAIPESVVTRARLSLGRGDRPIIETVLRILDARDAGGVLADIGCGTGDLWRLAKPRFSRCYAVDAVKYEALPADVEFVPADLDALPLPLADASADVCAAVEVIEHLENPRAFVRELVRVTRPGGWIVITTPNQLSALSLLTLIVKGRFSAFQESDYPAHRTALLEIDLRRMLAECGLRDVAVEYTKWGRVPLTPWHYPAGIASALPRQLSDNVAIAGRR